MLGGANGTIRVVIFIRVARLLRVFIDVNALRIPKLNCVVSICSGAT